MDFPLGGPPMQYPTDLLFLKVLYDWQTLLAGLLALVGAWLTVQSVRTQIKRTEAQAEAARKREEFAAKAILPLALSQLSIYGQDCIRLLSPLAAQPHIPEGTQTPRVPESAISVLQECTRYADERIASKIAVLLGKLQIQQSRLNELLTRRGGEVIIGHEITSNMIDAADVYARTADLYDYARNVEELRRRSTPDQLRRALHNCEIWDDDHPAMVHIHNLEQGEQP